MSERIGLDAQHRDDLARLGPFFTLDDPGSDDPDQDDRWRPVAELTSTTDLLDHRTTTGRSLLASLARVPEEQVETRVVVSVVTQGLAGRLLSPALALALLHGVVPHAADLRWQGSDSGPLPLAAGADVRLRPVAGPAAAVAAVEDLVLRTTVVPLLAHAQRAARLAPSLLRGNVASSAVGAVGMVVRAHPEVRHEAGLLLGHLLALPLLHGTGELGEGFTRSTCCLYYRVPGGGWCGDCPLPARR